MKNSPLSEKSSEEISQINASLLQLAARIEKDSPPTSPSRAKLLKVEFHVEAPLACSVKLAADFTDWDKHPLDMIKSMDGVWFTLVPLCPGQYSYRFIVDGEWLDDPRPAQRFNNPFGSANSVIDVA